ncbi:MAG: hypothetical protein KDD60_04865 [Bdellovibrionales bacterium]|nr:hypothetical protein [Bdellovibrionales bacterium]
MVSANGVSANGERLPLATEWVITVIVCFCAALFFNVAVSFAASEDGLGVGSEMEPIDQCARLVHGCFGSDEGETRSNCLFSTAKHPFCEGTTLGKLVYQRWLMAPARIGGLDEKSPGFLGPKLVDQECLANFDGLFVSSLVRGDRGSDQGEVGTLHSQLDSLSQKLRQCAQEVSPELSQP